MEMSFLLTEKPPRLRQLDSAHAREFLKNYQAYEARQEPGAAVPMRMCFEEPQDLNDLLEETDELVDEADRQWTDRDGDSHPIF